MGGDSAPKMVVEGIAFALTRYKNIHFILYGDEVQLEHHIAESGLKNAPISIVHAPEVITNDMKPSAALRNAKSSSMRRAIEAVKEGKADAVVSAGNTGAYMALSKILLGTLKGIARPAIATHMPTLSGYSVMLDLGANIECSEEHLVQFALMGEMFARDVLNIANPSVALLNIGAEALKGHSEVKAAHQILANSNMLSNFKGFVEGDDIMTGAVDVIVTDGFTGNVALKTIEGTVRFFKQMLEKTFKSSWRSKLGYLFVHRDFSRFRDKIDHRRHNGAPFLGVNGVAVKSHGGTDALGYSYAIGVAADMVERKLNEHISQELNKWYASNNIELPLKVIHGDG
jgi:glycerol-3-phosphate acyltransferase PlsX